MRFLRVLLILVSILVLVSAAGWVAWQKGVLEIDTQNFQIKFDWSKFNVYDLFDGKRNVKCAYTSQSGSGAGTADIYVWGKKIYAHYVGTNSGGNKNESYMIVGDKNIYAWTDPDSPGVVMPADGREAQLTPPEDGEGFTCERWMPDKKMFEPPTNIRFVDYKLMEDPDCGACEYLMGEQKEDCRRLAKCEVN